MALLAIKTAMRSSKPPELIVIDFSAFPGPGVVASLTVPREARLGMVRIGGAFVLGSMTGIAVSRCALETRAMAVVAIQASMCACQAEELIVIRNGALPGLSTVTVLAIGGEPCPRVIRIFRILIVL